MPTPASSDTSNVDVALALEALIARLEADTSLVDDFEFFTPFRDLAQKLKEDKKEVPEELVAEQIAFMMYSSDDEAGTVWGLYFGPMWSAVDRDGNPHHTPSLDAVTSEVRAYWGTRARSCVHAAMRGRYADLLWELPKQLAGVRPDPDMARVAIDAYVESIESGLNAHQHSAIARGRRALTLALSLGDAVRIDRVRDVLLALDDGVAPDEDDASWGFCFDLFVETPNPRILITEQQVAEIVAGLETRLARMRGRAEPSSYHPSAAEAAAVRLARHHRRHGRKNDVVRVLESYGDIVRQMRGHAAPMIVGHSLRQVYDLFQSFELRQQANDLNEVLRATGEETLADMHTISVEVPVDSIKLDQYFDALLTGSPETVLGNIATSFIPQREGLATELRKVASEAALVYMMPYEVVDEHGQTIARVGPLDTDPEGQLVRHIAQHLYVSTRFLREVLERGIMSGAITLTTMSDFIFASPLVTADRTETIRRGLRAFLDDDTIGAVHILVPQIEAGVRELARIRQRPIYAPRRGGGIQLRTLNDLFRDEGVSADLGPDISLYFQILLSDARGWNLRNDVCHGLAPLTSTSRPAADRIIHALLVLALFRAPTNDVLA